MPLDKSNSVVLMLGYSDCCTILLQETIGFSEPITRMTSIANVNMLYHLRQNLGTKTKNKVKSRN